MQRTFNISTDQRNGLYDITNAINEIIRESEIRNGIAHIYVKHATAAIMIQENWDESVQKDVVNLLSKLIPNGVWQHDLQDGNGDAHLKSGLVGPSELVPITNNKLALGRWQNIFLCEFDGPKQKREIVVTLIPDSN
jgi:secondary thiamine-phosphate synthase enzyme